MTLLNTYRFDEQAWQAATRGTRLESYALALSQAVSTQGHALKHGHLPRWNAAIERLPPAATNTFAVVDGAIKIAIPGTGTDKAAGNGMGESYPNPEALTAALQDLMPWRKGPFQFGPVFIDTEWRSDWKWERLEPHISALCGKTVLDVGCGSGYHLWRMRYAGACTVLGIDPSLLYVKQFEATQRFIQDPAVQLLPLPMDALPASMSIFDTVFSMGVLYHRRNPQEHLQELKAALRTDGELVLETLVIPGDEDQSLTIEGRYANMRNIYELPTTQRLVRWMSQAGFRSINVADVTPTSRREQRPTDWMNSRSLADALDTRDRSRTVEGYPRPLRAVVIATPQA